MTLAAVTPAMLMVSPLRFKGPDFEDAVLLSSPLAKAEPATTVSLPMALIEALRPLPTPPAKV